MQNSHNCTKASALLVLLFSLWDLLLEQEPDDFDPASEDKNGKFVWFQGIL